MAQALIDPTTSVVDNNTNEIIGVRIAQVSNEAFPVSKPLYWIDCSDTTDPSKDYYDPVIQEIKPIPPFVPTAEQNKTKAIQLLKDTDWVNEPDVYNPANTPHLLNRQEFLDYRVSIRQYAVNPIEGNINWPTKPVEQWST